MKTNPPEPVITPDDPFKHDQLGRKEQLEIPHTVFSTLQEPFVLALDAPWGNGKTTFIRIWQQFLIRKGEPCLYFNAWEGHTQIPVIDGWSK